VYLSQTGQVPLDNSWQCVAQNRSKKGKQSDFKHVVAAMLVLS